jgi:hypothetical protein
MCSADGARGRSSSVGSSLERFALFARSRHASRRRLTVSQRTTARGSLTLSLLRTSDRKVCCTTSSASAAVSPHCRAVCQRRGLTSRTSVSIAPGTPCRYSSKAVPARTTRSPASARRRSGALPPWASFATGGAAAGAGASGTVTVRAAPVVSVLDAADGAGEADGAVDDCWVGVRTIESALCGCVTVEP